MAEVSDKNPRKEKITMKATVAHPYLKNGEIFEVHPIHEAQLRERQWAVGENEYIEVVGAAEPQKVADSAATEAKSGKGKKA